MTYYKFTAESGAEEIQQIGKVTCKTITVANDMLLCRHTAQNTDLLITHKCRPTLQSAGDRRQ